MGGQKSVVIGSLFRELPLAAYTGTIVEFHNITNATSRNGNSAIPTSWSRTMKLGHVSKQFQGFSLGQVKLPSLPEICLLSVSLAMGSINIDEQWSYQMTLEDEEKKKIPGM